MVIDAHDISNHDPWSQPSPFNLLCPEDGLGDVCYEIEVGELGLNMGYVPPKNNLIGNTWI
jgi:hypothetical protein